MEMGGDHAGLNRYGHVLPVNFQNAIPVVGQEHDRALHREGASAQAGPRAPRNDRESLFVRKENDPGDLLRGGGRDDRKRKTRFDRRRVVGIGDEGLPGIQKILGTYYFFEFPDGRGSGHGLSANVTKSGRKIKVCRAPSPSRSTGPPS